MPKYAVEKYETNTVRVAQKLTDHWGQEGSNAGQCMKN